MNYHYNQLCVSKCVAPYAFFNSTMGSCMSSCAHYTQTTSSVAKYICTAVCSAYYWLDANGGQQCYAQCPVGYFINGQQCVTQCYAPSQYLDID